MPQAVSGYSLHNMFIIKNAAETHKSSNSIYRWDGSKGTRISGDILFAQEVSGPDVKSAFAAFRTLREQKLKVTFQKVGHGPSGIAHKDPFNRYKYVVTEGADPINPARCLHSIARHARSAGVQRPGVTSGGMKQGEMPISIKTAKGQFDFAFYDLNDILAAPREARAEPVAPVSQAQLLLQEEQQRRVGFFNSVAEQHPAVYTRLVSSRGAVAQVKFTDHDLMEFTVSLGGRAITFDIDHVQSSLFNIMLADVPHECGVWQDVQRPLPLHLVIQGSAGNPDALQLSLHPSIDVVQLQKTLDPKTKTTIVGRPVWRDRADYVNKMQTLSNSDPVR